MTRVEMRCRHCGAKIERKWPDTNRLSCTRCEAIDRRRINHQNYINHRRKNPMWAAENKRRAKKWREKNKRWIRIYEAEHRQG